MALRPAGFDSSDLSQIFGLGLVRVFCCIESGSLTS
jgi:hypothetical protein